MADNKKYYYLKLKDNFFDGDELLLLESMPDGYVYSNILLKLYLRSLKNEGKLMFNDRIPFNANMLAQITRHSVGDIEKAISIFRELGLIEILDNGAIFILDIQNYIGQSSSEADRKRDYRNRIEMEKESLKEIKSINYQLEDKCPTKCPTKCPDKSPPEKERELDKELELDKDNKKKDEKIKDNVNEKMFPSELPRENEKSFSLNNSIDYSNDKNYSNNTKDYSKYYRIGDIDIIDKLKDIIDIDKYILVNNNKYYIKDYSKMFLELYKIYCKELPSVRTFSNERQKVFKKFTKEYTPSEILHGLELICQSDFLKGKSPNSTWSANIDWIMKLGNFEKILSGVYNRTSSNGTTGGLKDSNIKKAGDKMGYEF